jgi:hypothetical protein
MTTDTTWRILATLPSTNGQFKVTARSGSRVAVIDRLTAEAAAAFTADDAATFFTAGLRPSAPLSHAVAEMMS